MLTELFFVLRLFFFIHIFIHLQDDYSGRYLGTDYSSKYEGDEMRNDAGTV